MGLLKQLMIFGKTGLQGLPTRVTLPFRAIQVSNLSTSDINWVVSDRGA
jgi:hypothetical protein